MLISELGGATPQVSWKIQSSLDGDQVADGSANWFDLACVAASNNPVTGRLGGSPVWRPGRNETAKGGIAHRGAVPHKAA